MHSDRPFKCSVCKRSFPWLHDWTAARCHTCDTMVDFVTRAIVALRPVPSGAGAHEESETLDAISEKGNSPGAGPSGSKERCECEECGDLLYPQFLSARGRCEECEYPGRYSYQNMEMYMDYCDYDSDDACQFIKPYDSDSD